MFALTLSTWFASSRWPLPLDENESMVSFLLSLLLLREAETTLVFSLVCCAILDIGILVL